MHCYNTPTMTLAALSTGTIWTEKVTSRTAFPAGTMWS